MLSEMLKLASLPLLCALAIGQVRPDAAASISKAQNLAESGRLPEAQQLLEEALGDLPDNSDLNFELGMVYLGERNWAKAIANYQASLRANPNRVKALFYLSEAYFLNSDFDRACNTLVEAVNIAPDDAQVRQKYGEYLSSRLATRAAGLQQLQKARQLNPRLPRIDFDIGKTEFDLTDFRAAEENFESELKKKADDGETAFFLAEANTKLGNWQKARQAYQSALAHGYAEGAAYYGMGRALVELEEFTGAIAPLQRALALQPSLIQAHFQLGRAYQRLGHIDEAHRERQLFAAMNGRVDTSRELRDPELEDACRHVKPLLTENKEQQALEYLAHVPEIKPDSPKNSYYLLGEMYFSMGRRGAAKRVLLTARRWSPEDARIAAYLGMVQLASGEIDAADQSFSSALTLDANESLALIGMGGIMYQRERWADAIRYLEKSRTIDPNTLLLLCDAYLRVGRRDDALLTAEVLRAFDADKQSLLDSLDQLWERYPSAEDSQH